MYKIYKNNTLYIKKYFNHLQYILIYNSQGGVKFSTGGDSLKKIIEIEIKIKIYFKMISPRAQGC